MKWRDWLDLANVAVIAAGLWHATTGLRDGSERKRAMMEELSAAQAVHDRLDPWRKLIRHGAWKGGA